MAQTNTKPKFSTIPAELRLKIYIHALSDPQIIHIKNYHNDPWNSMIKGFFSPPSASRKISISPLASLTHESRHLFLQHYHILCPDPSSSPASSPQLLPSSASPTSFSSTNKIQKKLYINPTTDTLLLDLSWLTYQLSHPFLDLLAPAPLRSKIRVLAIDFLRRDGGGLGHLLLRNMRVLFELLGMFGGVREVVFVLGRDGVDSKEGREINEGEEGDRKNREEGDGEGEWQWEEIPDGTEMGYLKERILRRVEWNFGEVKGHGLGELPRIGVLVAKGGEVGGCCRCGWEGVGF